MTRLVNLEPPFSALITTHEGCQSATCLRKTLFVVGSLYMRVTSLSLPLFVSYQLSEM